MAQPKSIRGLLKSSLLALSAVVSIVAGLLSLPMWLKIIIIVPFGAIFFILLGSLLQSLRFNDHRIKSWHLNRIRGSARDFLEGATKKAVGMGQKIEIDCMGIKLGTVSDFLHAYIKELDWSRCHIRYLILESGSQGAKDRETIEVRPRIDSSTEKGLAEAQAIRGALVEEYQDVNFEIKTCRFLPSFYIIRVNEVMFVGLYLRQKGRDCPYMIMEAGPESYYSHFKEYFDSIYGSDLSKSES